MASPGANSSRETSTGFISERMRRRAHAASQHGKRQRLSDTQQTNHQLVAALERRQLGISGTSKRADHLSHEKVSTTQKHYVAAGAVQTAQAERAFAVIAGGRARGRN
jgi:hypothetical protein